MDVLALFDFTLGVCIACAAVWRQDDPSITTRVFLVITRISCSSLFMLRKRRKSSTTNTLPNPAIVMVVSINLQITYSPPSIYWCLASTLRSTMCPLCVLKRGAW
jgi:hypothetical protein